MTKLLLVGKRTASSLVASEEILKEIDDVLKRPWLVEKYDYDVEVLNALEFYQKLEKILAPSNPPS